MRKRDEQLASYLGTNCPQVAMMGATGKKRKVLAATAEQVLRIIQSIPSPKAEPFKLWLAQVGRERIEETIDPEQAIDRALETYQKKGYDTDWIHQRLLSIRVRNELTTEWQERGVQQRRLLTWYSSYSKPDCSDGGATLFLTGADHGRCEKAKRTRQYLPDTAVSLKKGDFNTPPVFLIFQKRKRRL